MTQGRTPDTLELFNSGRNLCDSALSETSIYRLLYEYGNAFFPDHLFEDLYSKRGRHSVPPRIIATVMVLQRLEGLSDREAVERFTFDARWKYACGGLPAEHPSFGHTVLVYTRARLRESENPTRIFDIVLEVAREAGLIGVRRVLDSTPLYDAVATQDTVTLIRSAIRGVLRVADAPTTERVHQVLERDDAYDTPGKPVCDWDDQEAREALIDALARDGYAILRLFDGERLPPKLDEALRLLATVLGQDIEERDDGYFHIIRGVARDRIISTVDPEARHGHKTSARGFDGYKGHVAIDPDSEIITATAVTPANAGDGEVVEELLEDIAESANANVESSAPEPTQDEDVHQRTGGDGLLGRLLGWVVALQAMVGLGEPVTHAAAEPNAATPAPPKPEVYGDAAYGAAELLDFYSQNGLTVFTKVQKPAARAGLFSLLDFSIDLVASTVICPNQTKVPIQTRPGGQRYATFGSHCDGCPLQQQCTTARNGRTITFHPKFELLQEHREHQLDPGWQRQYRQTRPKVERKLAHMVRRKHGGRHVRVRGTQRVAQDFDLLGAALNMARLAQLRLSRNDDQWVVA